MNRSQTSNPKKLTTTELDNIEEIDLTKQYKNSDSKNYIYNLNLNLFSKPEDTVYLEHNKID